MKIRRPPRSEEHTSELQSHDNLVCRLLLDKKDHLDDVTYVFALLKHARLDYMVQKAVEMGAAKLQPLTTRHTQLSRVNLERMSANVIEAAEQCGILSLAAVAAPIALERFLGERDAQRLLVFCDEAAEITDPLAALKS